MSETTKKASSKKDKAFSAEERAAMKERAKEAKAAASREEGEKILLEKVEEMPEPERTMAKKLHAIITKNAPELAPKTWYGMPAYAKDDKVLCFFQSAQKFGSRYATLGFNDVAKLDDGDMFPVAYALMNLNAAEEKKITALIKKAIS